MDNVEDERVTSDGADGRNSATMSQEAGRIRFFHRVLMVLTAGVLVLGVVLLLWFQIHLLLLGFAGALLAVFLYRLASLCTRWTHMPYWLSLTVVCVLLLALLAGMGWLIGARISDQAGALQKQLPAAWQQARSDVREYAAGRWVMDRIGDAASSLEQAGLVRSGLGVVSSSGRVLAEVFTVLFIGLFGAISPEVYVRGGMRLVPLKRRGLVRELLQETSGILWWWIIGQLAAMAFIGVITGVAMGLLGVPLALSLALLAALLNFIPNFGPFLAAVPAVLLAVTVSPATAGWTIVIYLVIQFVQNQVVTPLIQQQALQLPPVIMIVAQLFMYVWAGLLGMALAPPLAALVIHLVQRLYVQRTLGDPMKHAKGFWPEGSGAG